jgi:hypothetical protein
MLDAAGLPALAHELLTRIAWLRLRTAGGGEAMIVKRKTRKAILKSVNKVVKKHGPKVAAGLAGSIASALAALAGTQAPGRKGKKSNLAALSERVSDAVGEGSRESRTKADKKKRKHGKKRVREEEYLEGSR